MTTMRLALLLSLFTCAAPSAFAMEKFEDAPESNWCCACGSDSEASDDTVADDDGASSCDFRCHMISDICSAKLAVAGALAVAGGLKLYCDAQIADYFLIGSSAAIITNCLCTCIFGCMDDCEEKYKQD